MRRVIMGLHRVDKTPCGFCFVEYEDREGAEMAMRYINHCRLDDRIIRTDWDAGFVEGRQFGRGRSGGQVSHHNSFHLVYRMKTVTVLWNPLLCYLLCYVCSCGVNSLSG